jgi:hypothetical protein
VDFFIQIVNQLILRFELCKWGIGQKHRYQCFLFPVNDDRRISNILYRRKGVLGYVEYWISFTQVQNNT